MQEISNKKKHKLIELIILFVIAISIIVLLLVLSEKKAGNTESSGNTENSKNREVFTEEEILDKCIETINEGDGQWLTYCKICHSDEAIGFLEYYYEVCDEYGWKDGEKKSDWKHIVKNGYEEEFATLNELFGDDYKITYSIKNKEEVDCDTVDINKFIYADAGNVGNLNASDEENIENRLALNGVPEEKIEKCLDLYESTFGGDDINKIYKTEVKFTVSGAREMTFTDTIWFAEVDGNLLPFKYFKHEDEPAPYFEHIIITPEYIANGMTRENNMQKQRHELIEYCVDGINGKSENWFGYDSQCNWHMGIELLEECFGVSVEKFETPKYVACHENGYGDEFSYLEEQFGEEFEVSFNVISDNLIEIDDANDEASYYELDEATKLEVEFVVTGTEEVKFAKEIWIVDDSSYIMFEGDLEKDEHFSELKPVVIDPVYMVMNVKEQLGE